MHVPETILQLVSFIGCQKQSGEYDLKGTGFYAVKLLTASPNSGVGYLVTAKHVIEGILSLGARQILIKNNLEDGTAKWWQTNPTQWFVSATKPELDVAACHAAFSEPVKQKFFNIENLPHPSLQLGTPVCFPGLFIHHHGIQQNLPIFRTGTVAALPKEKVRTSVGKIDAYLIEARSTGGLSGSPVFALDTEQKGYFMGMIQGHFGSSHKELTPKEEQLNAGIAIVIPSQEIRSLLTTDEIQYFNANGELSPVVQDHVLKFGSPGSSSP